jgi:hypothetical protein
LVVGSIEDDDSVARRAKGLNVVWSIVDVEVCFHFGLITQEADVSVGDSGTV